jgi:hypothetical protein
LRICASKKESTKEEKAGRKRKVKKSRRCKAEEDEVTGLKDERRLCKETAVERLLNEGKI